MKTTKMGGTGGLEVYLVGGVTVSGQGGHEVTSYADLDGLYLQLALEIALRHGTMCAEEVRFLRKRLGMTQADLGRLGGKTEQVALKWEKGTLPMPQAEATLLRLKWLNAFARPKVRQELASAGVQVPTTTAPCYVFAFDGQTWSPHRGHRIEATHYSADDRAMTVIANARASAVASAVASTETYRATA